MDPTDAPPIDNEEPEETPGYKAPAEKDIQTIQELDADDESLVKYKQTLLAGVDSGSYDESDTRRVVVLKMAICVEGREDIELDLTGDLSKLKLTPTTLKEGCEYKLKVSFGVNREIVSGLRYHHAVSRKGITVDKQSYMVGSYPPKAEPHIYTCPPDEAPKGMMARGHYLVKSKFIDDDKNVHLAWEWSFDIKKDWD